MLGSLTLQAMTALGANLASEYPDDDPVSDPVTRLNAALEGRYAIERELREGGMATVYLAGDLKHERHGKSRRAGRRIEGRLVRMLGVPTGFWVARPRSCGGSA